MTSPPQPTLNSRGGTAVHRPRRRYATALVAGSHRSGYDNLSHPQDHLPQTRSRGLYCRPHGGTTATQHPSVGLDSSSLGRDGNGSAAGALSMQAALKSRTRRHQGGREGRGKRRKEINGGPMDTGIDKHTRPDEGTPTRFAYQLGKS